MLDFDTILHEVGDFERYQKLMYFFICLPASFPSAWTAFNQVFVAAIPDHWCRSTGVNESQVSRPKNLTIPMEYREGEWRYSRCLQYNYSVSDTLSGGGKNYSVMTCQNGWEYDKSTYLGTVVTEYELVCDRAYWASLCTMIFYIGSFIGNILFGYVADKWGRRASFFALLTIQVVFGTSCAFAPNIYAFTVLRFMVGLSFPALYQIPFVIGMELMGPSGRMFAGIVVAIFFAFAMFLLGIVASFIREWSVLTLVCNAPFAILFTYWWFLPESPRWLVSARRLDEATTVLHRIARFNGRSVNAQRIRHQCSQVYRRSSTQEGDTSQDRHNLLDLFKTPNLRKKTLIITFIWYKRVNPCNTLPRDRVKMLASPAEAATIFTRFFAGTVRSMRVRGLRELLRGVSETCSKG